MCELGHTSEGGKISRDDTGSRDGGSRYGRYLKHFGSTVPVAEFIARRDVASLTTLRHDVDYSIDVALEMAAREFETGIRSTYFILHTADYWSDPLLLQKCLQMQDWGHEIGLHINLLAQWHLGEIDDIGAELAALLRPMRKAGLKVTGVAAHGDKLCYTAGFTNYWIFSDLRPDNPAIDEGAVTAEGTRAGESDRSISYPAKGDVITRDDGKSFDLWSMRLSDFSLDYEASRIDLGSYFSDSGGGWKRTADPLLCDLTHGRNVVLMHPLYWREPARQYYFLSTARSCSKWLARFLNDATSVTARHEFALNHTINGGAPQLEKRTGAGFTQLLEQPEVARDLIDQARGWSETLMTSYAEVNVYMEQFLDLIDEDENTTLVHLKRNPASVVRSILQRGWYEIPFDDRHPPVAIEGFAQMSQLEQACHYVCDTNARLSAACTHSLSSERIVSDLDYLTSCLHAMGIVVYPRLAALVFGERVNQTKSFDIAPLKDWSDSDRKTFERILGQTGHGAHRPERDEPNLKGRRQVRKLGKLVTGLFGRNSSAKPALATSSALRVLGDLASARNVGQVAVKNADLDLTGNGDDALVALFPSEGASYLLLGGGFWHGSKPLPNAYCNHPDVRSNDRPAWGGWYAGRDEMMTVGLHVTCSDDEFALRVLCLSYDENGALLGRKELGLLSKVWSRLELHFKPQRGASSFNIALYKSSDQGRMDISIDRYSLVSRGLERDKADTPAQTLERALLEPVAADRKPARVLIETPEQLSACFKSVRLSVRGSNGAKFEVIDGELQVAREGSNRTLFFELQSLPGLVAGMKHGHRVEGFIRVAPLQGDDSVSVSLVRQRNWAGEIPRIPVGVLNRGQSSLSFSQPIPEAGVSFVLTFSHGCKSVCIKDIELRYR